MRLHCSLDTHQVPGVQRFLEVAVLLRVRFNEPSWSLSTHAHGLACFSTTSTLPPQNAVVIRGIARGGVDHWVITDV